MHNAPPVYNALSMGLLYPRYVIIITMYNAQPNFSFKILGKKCALRVGKYTTSTNPESFLSDDKHIQVLVSPVLLWSILFLYYVCPSIFLSFVGFFFFLAE